MFIASLYPGVADMSFRGVNILSNGLIGLVKVSGFAVLTDERLNGYRRASSEWRCIFMTPQRGAQGSLINLQDLLTVLN